MTPLILVAVGIALLAAAALILRSFGPRFRVGRLLASTPRVSVAEARAMADRDRVGYVRVDGRLDSEDEFEDADHRPLVLRRTRLQAAAGRAWRTIDERFEQVAFALNEGVDTIAIDAAALSDGLVVVPRESTGTAADLPEPRADLTPDTPVRLRVEQLSSVEHAIALGVPVRVGREVRLTAGMGRPLVLSTVEPREAMRILAEGRTFATRLAAVLIGAGVLVGGVGLVWLIVDALR